MNLASALIKQILVFEDMDTWANLRKHYLPREYFVIHESIDRFLDSYNKLPTFEELQLYVRDGNTKERIAIIEATEVDTEPFLLLDYIKNEFTQKEALNEIHNFVEKSISFESAGETIQHIYDIAANLETKVDVLDLDNDMQRINLFEEDDVVAGYIRLGINEEFDKLVRFKQTDYIIVGAFRGIGKSALMNNVARAVMEDGGSVLYYSVEMPSREVLQRQCSVETGISTSKFKYKTLDNEEWVRVAKWWSNRYKNGDIHFKKYLEHRDFNKFHTLLSREQLTDIQFHVVFDPEMTLSFIKTDSAKMVKKLGNVRLIIVDYLNQVRRFSASGPVNIKHDMYDWKEQINISKGLRDNAAKLEVTHISPIQTAEDGTVRLSKSILDAATAAYTMSRPKPNVMHFKRLKARDDSMEEFASVFHESCLQVGPESATIPEPDPPKSDKKKFNKQVEEGIYDDKSDSDSPPW